MNVPNATDLLASNVLQWFALCDAIAPPGLQGTGQRAGQRAAGWGEAAGERPQPWEAQGQHD